MILITVESWRSRESQGEQHTIWIPVSCDIQFTSTCGPVSNLSVVLTSAETIAWEIRSSQNGQDQLFSIVRLCLGAQKIL